jgi:hypothetical protein
MIDSHCTCAHCMMVMDSTQGSNLARALCWCHLLGHGHQCRYSSSGILRLNYSSYTQCQNVKSWKPRGVWPRGTGVCQVILPGSRQGANCLAEKLKRLTLSSDAPSDLDVLSHNLSGNVECQQVCQPQMLLTFFPGWHAGSVLDILQGVNLIDVNKE